MTYVHCISSDVESQHNSRKGVPKRRLSRNNSAKKNNGSFRGGSLKNVMEEEVEADMQSLSNHDDESGGTIKGNDIKQTRRRGISRNNSGKRRVAPIMNSEDDNTSHAPARRLSRGNSARNGSFRGGSLKNVLEDKEADDMDSVNLGDSNEKNAEVPGERRRSYPPSSARSDSFRTNSLRSIRLCNSTSSLSSCASSSLHQGSSLTIMDFRQNSSRYSVGSSSDADRDSSSNNVSSMLDSTDLDCCWGDMSCRNMTGHPVLSRMAMASMEGRGDSMGSSAFLNWVNQGGEGGTNDNKAKSKCLKSNHSQVTRTTPTAKPKRSRRLFKQIRRLSSGLGLTGGIPRRSWNESTEDDPHRRSTINASNTADGDINIGKGKNESRADGDPRTLRRRSNASAPIDEIENKFDISPSYVIAEPPANNNTRTSRRRRFLDRLSKSLTSSFRRSSMDDNNDPNATKASSRRLRNSTGNMVASEDLDDDYL